MARYQAEETGIRNLKFNFGNPIAATIYDETQSDHDKPYRLELEIPAGTLRFTYHEWVRFAQSITVLMNPNALLED